MHGFNESPLQELIMRDMVAQAGIGWDAIFNTKCLANMGKSSDHATELCGPWAAVETRVFWLCRR